MSNKYKVPSLLSMTGAVDPSHALFFSSDNGVNKTPLEKESVGVLGTLGSYSELTKIKKDREKDEVYGNPQEVDVCYLPANHNILHVNGNIKFSNQIENINSNDSIFINALKDIYFEYDNNECFETIIYRFFIQMLNGGVLFRNKYSPEIKLILSDKESKKEFTVNQLLNFDDINSLKEDEFLKDIYEKIRKAFTGREQDVFLLTYEYMIDIGYNQEVYPSQEFLEGGEKGKKILFETFYKNKKITGMHSQKIGNGLRTIDDWYSDGNVKAIPVDPFGPDKKQGLFRRKNNNHIYEILSEVVNKNVNNESIDYHSNDIHYLIASILRGGVYSGEGKK